jgi:hypothetical protein
LESILMDNKIYGDQYSEIETQRRFEKLVRRALNTKPKPLKSMGPKGVPAQSKKRRRKTKRAA